MVVSEHFYYNISYIYLGGPNASNLPLVPLFFALKKFVFRIKKHVFQVKSLLFALKDCFYSVKKMFLELDQSGKKVIFV